MLLRFFVCITLMGTTAFAGWPREIGANNYSSVDSPPPHPLAYFKGDPCLRPPTDTLVRAMSCTYVGKTVPTPDERKSWSNTQTELVEIGRIGRLTIYDLWYDRERGFYPDFDLRSVLVKIDKDLYREINVREVRRKESFPASKIVTLDGESILVAKFHDGGNDPFIYETLYMFRATGLETPDFSAVGEAVAKLKAPKNMSGVIEKYDYESMTYTFELYRNDTNLPRVDVTERGRITVTYRFVNGRAVVTGSKYEPYSQ